MKGVYPHVLKNISRKARAEAQEIKIRSHNNILDLTSVFGYLSSEKYLSVIEELQEVPDLSAVDPDTEDTLHSVYRITSS